MKMHGSARCLNPYERIDFVSGAESGSRTPVRAENHFRLHDAQTGGGPYCIFSKPSDIRKDLLDDELEISLYVLRPFDHSHVARK